MKKIAITGGKGGTGKSTVSILLANKLKEQGKKVVLCDCDVECPNNYLLLSKRLTDPIKKVFARFPKLIKEKCRRCGLCVKNCRSQAVFMAPQQYPVFLNSFCSSCGLCWHLCPHKAIKVKKKIIGEIFSSQVDNNFYLITGRLKGVVEETGPIVSQTKNEALKIARKEKADYVLFDTAAGLHCGVIRALINVDLAYVVTEPTPLGAHNLDLILKLLVKLKISPKVVLNQADLGEVKSINKVLEKFGIKIKFKIPYSYQLIKAYSEGRLEKVNIKWEEINS